MTVSGGPKKGRLTAPENKVEEDRGGGEEVRK
jgi:hypothetical protein